VEVATTVVQTRVGCTYTRAVSTPRDEIESRAWAVVQDVVRELDVDRDGTPVLLLPVGDGDPVTVFAGVFHHGNRFSHRGVTLQRDMRPGGVHVRFAADGPPDDGQRRAMLDWLADNGFDSAGTPWATLADGRVHEVLWPVRPVRDTDTFIGRHGPRAFVAAPGGALVDEERHAGTVRLIGNALDRFEAGTARPSLLERVWCDAAEAAQLTHVLRPDDAEIVRWLRLAARAGLADLTHRATGEPVTLELDGRTVTVTSGGSVTWSHRLVNAVFAALAVADPVALGLLRRLPVDALAGGSQPLDDHTLTRVIAVRSLALGDWRARDALRALLTASESSARLVTGPWFAHTEVPVWKLGLALLDGDQAAFTAAQRAALLAYREWYGHTSENPGELQDANPEGFLAVRIACLAALWLEAGGELTLDSEYVPRCILDAARDRRDAGAGEGAWPGPPTPAALAEGRRAARRDRAAARRAAAAAVAERYPAAEPLLTWPAGTDETADTDETDDAEGDAEATTPGFRPDDLDGVWRLPGPDAPRLVAVSVSGGDHPLPELPSGTGDATVPAGTRDYLRRAADRLRGDGRADVADALLAELLTGDLVYLHVTPGSRGQPAVQPFDVSDEALVATLLQAVRRRPYRSAEDHYTPMGDRAAGMLVAAYRRMPDLAERELVQTLLFAGAPLAAGRPVYEDMLARSQAAEAAGAGLDVRVAASMAVSGLELDRDRFGVLLHDDDAFAEAVRRQLPTAVPIGQSTAGTPAGPEPAAPERGGRGLFRRGGRPPVDDAPVDGVDVNDPVRSALTAVMPRVAKRAGPRLRFGTDLRSGLPRITCRPAEIEDVVTVLVENAAAAMERAGRWELDVTTYASAGDVVVQVSDGGDGVPPELRERLLDPDWRSPRGLLRARWTVAGRHGGSLGFTTTAGQGTTMLVRLPARGD
jgi:hypothetical protein